MDKAPNDNADTAAFFNIYDLDKDQLEQQIADARKAQSMLVDRDTLHRDARFVDRPEEQRLNLLLDVYGDVLGEQRVVTGDVLVESVAVEPVAD